MAMHTDKTTPMTDAQRQRKHREKRRRELEALRAVVPSSENERDLQAQVQRLASQLDKATRAAATLQARIGALEVEQGDLQRLREALSTLLPMLTPAVQHVARTHLESCGAAQWLSPQTPPPQAAAPPSTLSSRVFF